MKVRRNTQKCNHSNGQDKEDKKDFTVPITQAILHVNNLIQKTTLRKGNKIALAIKFLVKLLMQSI